MDANIRRKRNGGRTARFAVLGSLVFALIGGMFARGAIIPFDGVFKDVAVEDMQLLSGTVTVSFTDFFGWNNDIDHTAQPGAGALAYGSRSGASSSPSAATPLPRH